MLFCYFLGGFYIDLILGAWMNECRILLKGTDPRAKGNPYHSKTKNRKRSAISESFRFQSFQRWTCFKSSLIFVVEMPSVRGR